MSEENFPILSPRLSNHRSTPTLKKQFFVADFKIMPYTFDSVIPRWLLDRRDFKDRLKQLTRTDIANICSKLSEERSGFEKESVAKWIKDCPYFSSMSNRKLLEISNLLKTHCFVKGANVIKEGEIGDCLYVILKGQAGIYLGGITQPIAIKHPRNVVGEAALENAVVRTATVKAETDLIVLALSCIDYLQFAQKERQREKHEIKVFLKTASFFKDLLPSKLEILGNTILVMEYSKNQNVYKLDESAHHLYIIKQGSVLLEAPVCFDQYKKIPSSLREWNGSDTRREMNQILKYYGPAEFFGEREMILGIPRDTQAVVTADRTVLYILSKQSFDLIFSHSDKAKMLKNSVCRPTSKEMRENITKKVEAINTKLNSLLNACDINVRPTDRSSTIDRKIIRKVTWARSLAQRYKDDLTKELNTVGDL
ncbi:unnamed protein product [Blepharisma stoltei]|uniref:Cyclic nucleotide-binding domain-containing protein n=1 Tax=Blepharisma stoltei TaxID=1481888 RepID=A0AAU9JWW5_9CILI|nr:unnamed protein product [Blepharisma stoltei]